MVTEFASCSSMSDDWEEIQGCNDWQGLLPSKAHESFDERLRSEIIRYGEFAQACYDGFESNEIYRDCGNAKFSSEEMLQAVGLPNTGYQITCYLYATSKIDLPRFFVSSPRDDTWCTDSNWMGFVAVATSQDEIRRLGRRDIVVAWRGTVTKLEWIENIKDFLKPCALDPTDQSTEGVKVESGFLSVYTSSIPSSSYNNISARQQLHRELNRLMNLFKGEQLSITVTGHSLGGALALLSAYDIVELGLNRYVQIEQTVQRVATQSYSSQGNFMRAASFTRKRSYARFGPVAPVTVFSFSAPRLGNRHFRERCADLGLKVLRVFNKHDLVPKVPGVLINEDNALFNLFDVFPWAYTHVGTELELDSRLSPYLRDDAGIVEQHNLEALLHLVDGYQGPGRRFQCSGKRDIALVNKRCDFLKPELGVPVEWGVSHEDASSS